MELLLRLLWAAQPHPEELHRWSSSGRVKKQEQKQKKQKTKKKPEAEEKC